MNVAAARVPVVLAMQVSLILVFEVEQRRLGRQVDESCFFFQVNVTFMFLSNLKFLDGIATCLPVRGVTSGHRLYTTIQMILALHFS